MDDQSMADLQVVIPNLHWRYTGVTATNRMIAPRAALLIGAAWFGRDAPPGIRAIGLRDVMRLWRRSEPVVWHARRNDEMIVGLALKWLGWPLRPIFTSAAQRDHSWLTHFLVGRMDGVMATTDEAARRLRRPATVVTHGIDTERYAPAADRGAALAAAGIPQRFAIGCFGRVRAQKGTDVFVEAMCRLLPRHPDFCAVVVGAVTPDNRGFADRLRQRAEASGIADRMHFLGELPADDVPAWFGRVLIYAFTSRNEGFGLTLLEAMSSGAAVVASRAGAAELVVEEGVTGFVVPPGDVDALVAGLEPLMRDPVAVEGIGLRGRQRVLEKFGVDAEVERIVAFYRGVLGS